jgi:hypothetical protein
MEEAQANGKESSHSAHANGMNDWMDNIILAHQHPVGQDLFIDEVSISHNDAPQ